MKSQNLKRSHYLSALDDLSQKFSADPQNLTLFASLVTERGEKVIQSKYRSFHPQPLHESLVAIKKKEPT
jgi:hypothetical protein